MNKHTERIITIGLAVGLIAYFCYQVVYGAKETCPGFMDGSKFLIMDIHCTNMDFMMERMQD